MTIDVVCSGCQSAYVLDESAAGGKFVCPSCSHTLTIERPSPAPAVAAAVAASSTAAVPGTSTMVQASPPAVAEAPKTRSEIVCPRCDLHFAPEKHTVDVVPGDRPHILIVEEEGYSREATIEALSAEYDVVAAGTVDAAARILALGGIDLMILDVDLDQGFGKRLLRQGHGKTCPVVIYGHDEAEFYGEAWEASRRSGVDDMVIKGMNAAEALVRKVGALLGRRPGEEHT